MTRRLALLLLVPLLVAVPLTTRPAAAATGSTYTVQILDSGCVSGAKARQTNVEDPSGTSPGLTGPVTVVFANDDACQHCITTAASGGMLCVDPNTQKTFDLDAVGKYGWVDHTAQAQDYVQGASGTIVVSSIASPPAAAPTQAPASAAPPAATSPPPAAAAPQPSATAAEAVSASTAPASAAPAPTSSQDPAATPSSTADTSAPVELPAALPTSSSSGVSGWVGPAIAAGALSTVLVAGSLGLWRRRRSVHNLPE